MRPYREASIVEPRRRDYRPLFRALYAVGLLCVASGATSLVVLACRPNLGPVVNCRVGSYACVNGRPVVCSSSQRHEPAGDRSCASVGAICVVDDGGPAHCAPVVDASTDGGAE
jgi:hypothetical protein